MTLVELALRLERALDEAINPDTGEVAEGALDALLDVQAELADKIDAYQLVTARLQAEAKATKAEADALESALVAPLQAKAKAVEASRARLLKHLGATLEAMGGSAEGHHYRVALAKSKCVASVADQAALDPAFLKALRWAAAAKLHEQAGTMATASYDDALAVVGKAWLDERIAEAGAPPAGMEYKPTLTPKFYAAKKA